MNPRTLLLAALAALAASGNAAAVGRLVDLTVYDRTSEQALPVYAYQGRYYVAGQPGHRYEIQLRSREYGRLLSVLSVDGINAISGDTADWSQTGYVLAPRASAQVRGWRKSLSEVADFVFADASNSYAERTGRPDNVGVIGVAVFRPRELQPAPGIAMAKAQQAPPAPAPAAPAAPVESSAAAAPRAAIMPVPPPVSALPIDRGPLGTGHGERENSQVNYTNFQRASRTPDEIITLYYDTRERLIAQGVLPQASTLPTRPDPFPGHFVPDPR
ncbi:hypothetical protein [Dyella sp. ASV21]|uniref:hypothetical protein n=1 Tax=Dyella sp. ASV21 TaxID=2795114 RepID=UPI0018EE0746|nr:hypothetical protein [Dyella sp. ASV21]